MNNPDKIIFVGEALVGNEAVDQLTKFDRALRDFSSASGTGKGRGIDGMLVTKWDTVDDKVRSFTAVGSLGTSNIVGTTRAFLLLHIGRSSAFNDLCHWPAYHIRGLWTGASSLCCFPRYTDVRVSDVHRFEAVESRERSICHSQRLNCTYMKWTAFFFLGRCFNCICHPL